MPQQIQQLYLLTNHDTWVRHHGMVHPQVVDGGTVSNMDGSRKYTDRQSWTANKGWSSSSGVGQGANNSP